MKNERVVQEEEAEDHDLGSFKWCYFASANLGLVISFIKGFGHLLRGIGGY